jgi:hypothetical protein
MTDDRPSTAADTIVQWRQPSARGSIGDMTEYQFHWWLSGNRAKVTPGVKLEAESPRHGAALALRHFKQSGSDITAPLAHVDTTEPDGVKHTLLVEEVLDWLRDPKQTAFVEREGLAVLLD